MLQKEKRTTIESAFEEAMDENFQILKKITDTKYKKDRRSQTRWIETDLHKDIFKMAKVKESIIKAVREKELITR